MPWTTPQKRPVGYVIKKADDWDVIVDDLIYLKGVITGSGEQRVQLGGAEPQLTISGSGRTAKIYFRSTSPQGQPVDAGISLNTSGEFVLSASSSVFRFMSPNTNIAIIVNSQGLNNTPQFAVRLSGSGSDSRRFVVSGGSYNQEISLMPQANAGSHNPIVTTGDSVVATYYPSGGPTGTLALTTNSNTAVGFRIVYTGTIQYWGSLVQQSDEQLKTDIVPIANVTEKLRKWRVVRYRWSDARLGQEPRIGLIAQDVQANFPELVAPVDWDGQQYLGLDYDRLTALLVRAIQELDQRLTNLEQRLAPLPVP